MHRQRRRRSSWAASTAARKCPADINPVTKDGVAMIAGTGLIGVAKDNLPRVGVTPGLTATFAEIELDTETGKFKILDMLMCGRLRHGAASARAGAPDPRRQRNGHRLARLERHVYDPKLGIPTTVLLYQAKLPGYLDVPVGDRLGRGGEARSAKSDRRERGRRAAARFGRRRDHHGDLGRNGRSPVQPHAGFDRHDPESRCRGARRRTSRFRSTRSEGASP